MSFYVWTCVGVAIAILHLLVPRPQHRVGAASAIALGVSGALGGALLVSTVVQGGWIFFGSLALAGAIVGAVGAVEGVELAAERMMRADADAEFAERDPARRARLHA